MLELFGIAKNLSLTPLLKIPVWWRRAVLGALGVQSSTSHPGPGSSEAHPAGRMIGIGLRAREPLGAGLGYTALELFNINFGPNSCASVG